MDSLYIAWRYVCYYRFKSATLVACVTLIVSLPLALEVLLDASERQFTARARQTPLVIGAKGSALDLVMNTLYFDDEIPEMISMAAAEKVTDSDLALPIPISARFKARGNPIVGTTLDYFEFRGLRIGQGRMLAMLGDCVLGATVADNLGLKTGDSLVQSPESLFDLAGVYPLKMKVVGILEKAFTPDDLAVFVDLKTDWVIQGLGHGHQDVTRLQDPTLVLKRTETNVAATTKLYHYTEITVDTVDTFHFHGDLNRYPITAVIAVPYDAKSGTRLRGRYLASDESQQIIVPEAVIDGLLQNIFRIKKVLDAVIGVVALATVLALILVFVLSLRLRQQEMRTMFKIGCQGLMITRLMAAEILLIAVSSGALCLIIAITTRVYAADLVRFLFIR